MSELRYWRIDQMIDKEKHQEQQRKARYNKDLANAREVLTECFLKKPYHRTGRGIDLNKIGRGPGITEK